MKGRGVLILIKNHDLKNYRRCFCCWLSCRSISPIWSIILKKKNVWIIHLRFISTYKGRTFVLWISGSRFDLRINLILDLRINLIFDLRINLILDLRINLILDLRINSIPLRYPLLFVPWRDHLIEGSSIYL